MEDHNMSGQTISELFDLKGKGAIVTGGALGIGKSIVLRLAEAGASVMISDINLEEANKTAEEVKASGGHAIGIKADAASAGDAGKVAQAAVDAFGSLNILVNNAGIYPFSPVLATTEDLWDKVIDINLKGVFLYSQAAAQIMSKSQKGGKIINIASMDAIKPTGMCAHYDASKGGVAMLTKAMALELAPMKILVNAIAPGAISTPGAGAVNKQMLELTGISSEQMLENMIKLVPVGRMGEPDDIAKVVLFLASGASDYMCGEMILVDGGSLLS
jgi:2-dehydro-3-deoxy-D-gluconate 5-dehydrogenase